MRICYSLDSWSHFFCSHFYNTLHGGYGMTILTTPFPSFSSESNPYSIHLLKPINWIHSISSHWNHFNWIHLFGHIILFSPCGDPYYAKRQNWNYYSNLARIYSPTAFSVSILSTLSILAVPLGALHVTVFCFITCSTIGVPVIVSTIDIQTIWNSVRNRVVVTGLNQD